MINHKRTHEIIHLSTVSTSRSLIECENSEPLLIDTPTKYAQLQEGQFNDKYQNIWITSDAHPDILLQPQFFAKSKFHEIRFISLKTNGNNTIILQPKLSRVDVQFNVRETPLSGVPRNYRGYSIYYSYLPPTTENINSIFSWKEAKSLRILDRHSVIVRLLQRIDEFSKLKQLHSLDLCIEPHTYDLVNITQFIGKLPALKEMVFTGNRLTEIQLQHFKRKNKIPWNWRLVMFAQSFYYYKERI